MPVLLLSMDWQELLRPTKMKLDQKVLRMQCPTVLKQLQDSTMVLKRTT
jgi:hypothetical protein